VCHNPEAAARDAAVRDRLVEHLEALIAGSDTWSATRRDEFVGSLKATPGLRRTPGGLLRIDRAAANRDAHLDGKWLLRTSDMTLTAGDLAAAYNQLIAIERGWRDGKGSLGLRPVFHHREDRIRAHVAAVLAGAAAHPGRRNHRRRHLAHPAPRTRPHAPSHPGHRRRPRRATFHHQQLRCSSGGKTEITELLERLHPVIAAQANRQ
jgi:hypothetical protein